jgi:hypothetical protein
MRKLTGGRMGSSRGSWSGWPLHPSLARHLLLIPVAVVSIIAFVAGAVERMLQGFNLEDRENLAASPIQGDQAVDHYEVTSGRSVIWPYVIAKVKESPMFGYGRRAMTRTGLAAFLFQELRESFPHPHNAYLEFLFDNGWIGFVLVMPFYLVMMFHSVSLLLDSRSMVFVAAGGACLALILALLVASAGSQTFYPREGAVGMWCAIGLMLRVKVERERAQVEATARPMATRTAAEVPRWADLLVPPAPAGDGTVARRLPVVGPSMTTPRTRLVYLLAASHSGSTLVGLLLGSHPEISTVGELKFTSLGDIDRYRCSCGEFLLQCPFWRKVRSELATRGRVFDPWDGSTDLFSGVTPYMRRALPHRGAFSSWSGTRPPGGTFVAVAPEIMAGATPVGADSIPHHRQAGCRRFPKVGIRLGICCATRPSRSGASHRPRRASGGPDVRRSARTRTPATNSRAAVARAATVRRGCPWARRHGHGGGATAAQKILARLPREASRVIRYEDVCADPHATLRPVLEWIGVDPRAPLGLARGTYHVVGNGMRLDSTREVKLDDRWRTPWPRRSRHVRHCAGSSTGTSAIAEMRGRGR